MRVLYWTDYFWPIIGGVEVFGVQLIRALVKRGYEFTVATSSVAGAHAVESFGPGVTIRRFPFREVLTRNDLPGMMAIRQQVANLKRDWQPDLVHLNPTGASAMFHCHTENAWPAPCLLTLHIALPISPDKDTLLGKLLRSAQWVTGVSESTLADATRLAPEIATRSSVIHNSVSAPDLEATPLPFNPPCIACLGRLTPQKGFDLALAAFAAVRPRHPHVRLIVAGDGEERPALERQAAALELGSAIEFTGWIAPEKVPDFLNRATLVLMPSRWEPFGIVALQAAQMGRPVIATNVGGLSEVVAHRLTGLVVQNEDVTGLSTALACLLDNPQWAGEMGRAARQRAALFSYQRFADGYDALYRQLGQGERTCPAIHASA